MCEIDAKSQASHVLEWFGQCYFCLSGVPLPSKGFQYVKISTPDLTLKY